MQRTTRHPGTGVLGERETNITLTYENRNTYNAIAFKSSLELLKSVRMLMPLMLTILLMLFAMRSYIFIFIMVMEPNVFV